MSRPSARKGHPPRIAATPFGRSPKMHCKRTIATTATAAALTIGGTAVAAAAEYTVAPGDTLSEIAGSYSADWQDVYAANRHVIGADPDLIYPGTVLSVGGAQGTPPNEVAPAAAAASVVLPVDDYRITARFGDCGAHWANCHTGLDFAAVSGTPVRAVRGGTVTAQQWVGGYGNRVIVDHGDGWTSHYAHLSAFGEGGRVDAGDVIGYVGSTGNSTGPHVHVELRRNGSPVDPYAWLVDRGVTP